MTLFKLKHVLFIITLSLSCGYGLLWLLYHPFKYLIPYSELVIHILIYVILYLTTTRVYSTVNILKVHQAFGFKHISFKYVLLAMFSAFFIWGMDYLYQTNVLSIDMLSEAHNWNNSIKVSSTSAIFISMVIIAPLIEEILFRGIFLQTINRYLNKF